MSEECRKVFDGRRSTPAEHAERFCGEPQRQPQRNFSRHCGTFKPKEPQREFLNASGGRRRRGWEPKHPFFAHAARANDLPSGRWSRSRGRARRRRGSTSRRATSPTRCSAGRARRSSTMTRTRSHRRSGPPYRPGWPAARPPLLREGRVLLAGWLGGCSNHRRMPPVRSGRVDCSTAATSRGSGFRWLAGWLLDRP